MEELAPKKMLKINGGVDPVSVGIGIGLSILVEGVTKACTGKSASDWVDEGCRKIKDAVICSDGGTPVSERDFSRVGRNL